MGPTTDHGRGSSAANASPPRPVDDDLFDPPERDGAAAASPEDSEGHTLIGASRGRSEPATLDGDTDGGRRERERAEGGRSQDDEAPEAQPLALQRALREVEATVDSEMVKLLDHMESLRHQEEALQEQLEQLYLELGSVQDGLAGNSKALRGALEQRQELGRKRYELQATTVMHTLMTEAAELRERERLWKERVDEAESRLRAFKENPALAEQIQEFRRLDERMDTLELLPESYREIVRSHHSSLKEKLRPHLEEPKLDAPSALRLAVAVAVSGGRKAGGIAEGDAEEERPARLLAVLPVDFKTHERAREGKTDLTARFAFRVLAALSRFVVHIGARSDARPVDLGGLLGIELPFDDLDFPVSPADLARALRESFAEARDNQMAKISVFTDMVFVSMEGLEILWARAEAARNGDGKGPPTRNRSRNPKKK
jgi:hypothetical protein